MLNDPDALHHIYNDAEWVTVKNQTGTWIRIAEIGGLSLVAKWIRNDLLNSGSLDILGNSIETLGLRGRTIKALFKDDIYTIGDLCSKTRFDLMCIPGVGDLGRQDIVEALEKHNLQLKPMKRVKR